MSVYGRVAAVLKWQSKTDTLIKWASTVPLKAASNPNSQPMGQAAAVGAVPIPAPPPSTSPIDPGDVF